MASTTTTRRMTCPTYQDAVTERHEELRRNILAERAAMMMGGVEDEYDDIDDDMDAGDEDVGGGGAARGNEVDGSAMMVAQHEWKRPGRRRAGPGQGGRKGKPSRFRWPIKVLNHALATMNQRARRMASFSSSSSSSSAEAARRKKKVQFIMVPASALEIYGRPSIDDPQIRYDPRGDDDGGDNDGEIDKVQAGDQDGDFWRAYEWTRPTTTRRTNATFDMRQRRIRTTEFLYR